MSGLLGQLDVVVFGFCESRVTWPTTPPVRKGGMPFYRTAARCSLASQNVRSCLPVKLRSPHPKPVPALLIPILPWTVPATHHPEFVLQAEFVLRQSDYFESAHADITSASRRGRMEPLIMFFLATWVGAQPCRADLAPSHRLASLGHNRATQAPEVRCTNNAAVSLLELQCAMHVTKFSSLQVT